MDKHDADQELFELLPWYVNGTLTEAEHQQVEELLARDMNARAMRDQFLAIQSMVARQESSMPEPGEFAWHQFQKRLRETSSRAGIVWPRIAGIAAAMVIAIQVSLFTLTEPDTALFDQQGQLLSGNIIYNAEDYLLYQVRFKETASNLAVMDDLRRLGAQIISGPSAQGFYHIVVPKDSVASQSLWLTQARSMLTIDFIQEQIEE